VRVPELRPPPPDDAPAQPWVLYLLECAGERLYAGITNDLAARYQAHVDGRGARFTRAFAPVRIVAAAELPSRSAALKAEYALKQQARANKLRFLAGCGTPLVLPSRPIRPGATTGD
jgi:putative endonuclease